MSNSEFLKLVDDVLVKFAKDKLDESDPLKLVFSQDKVDSGDFRKIALDVYKVDNDPYDGLWVLQDLDGQQHLVRASDPRFESEKTGDWEALTDYDKTNITLAFKGVPVARLSNSDFGFTKDDVGVFKSALLEKAANDSEFMKDLLKAQPKSRVEDLVISFPEFKKYL